MSQLSIKIKQLLLLIVLVAWQGNLMAMAVSCCSNSDTPQIENGHHLAEAPSDIDHQHYTGNDDIASDHEHTTKSACQSCCAMNCTYSCSTAFSAANAIFSINAVQLDNPLAVNDFLFDSGYVYPPYRPPIA